jgi:hypothetical protein
VASNLVNNEGDAIVREGVRPSSELLLRTLRLMNLTQIRSATVLTAALFVIAATTSIEAAGKKSPSPKKKVLVELYTSQG